jgi:hypothetical protein
MNDLKQILGRLVAIASIVVIALSLAHYFHQPPIESSVVESPRHSDAAATLTFGAGAGRDGWIINDTKNVIDFARDVTDGYRKDGKVEGKIELLMPQNMRGSNAAHEAGSWSAANVNESATSPSQQQTDAQTQLNDTASQSGCEGGACGVRYKLLRRWQR